MENRGKFLCSLWQEKQGVDIFSTTKELLPLLKTKGLISFIPGYSCNKYPANTGYKVYYHEQKNFTLTCSEDKKVNTVKGALELIGSGEVVTYLACALLEIQRQKIGQTSIHAAIVSINQQGILLMGKEGSGKTSIALHLCRKYDYKLIANDIAIIGLEKNKVFAYEGTKFFRLRLGPVKNYYPDLVKFFCLSSNKDTWTNRILLLPHQINIEVENKKVPIVAAFFLHIDSSIDKLHIERSLNRWPRLYLYENLSRYIRRTCSPMMGGKDFHYLAYLPSLDNPNFHIRRVNLINCLIENIGIDYLSGQLASVGEVIHQRIF